MATLAAATRRARELARDTGTDAYVVEYANDPPGEWDGAYAADERTEDSDPAYFTANHGSVAAIVIRDLGRTNFLLRVARPDGTVEPVTDADAEGERLLAHYPDSLPGNPHQV
jgi:hypothetical protein